MATYLCHEGFHLGGENFRICEGDGLSVNGDWNGSAPVCTGEFIRISGQFQKHWS